MGRKEKEIRYSKSIPGDAGNYRWSVSFDDNNGYIGINQVKDGGGEIERVLLSKAQVRALLKFCRNAA